MWDDPTVLDKQQTKISMSKQKSNHLKSYWYSNCRKTGNWESFEHFLLSVGPPPKNNMRLTRKCIKTGYTPENLMWAKAENRSSRYLVNTFGGNTASLRHACEQDGVKYPVVYNMIKNYDLTDCPQAAYNFGKLTKESRRTIRRKAFVEAIKGFQNI